MKLLILGAGNNSFVGSSLACYFKNKDNYEVQTASRSSGIIIDLQNYEEYEQRFNDETYDVVINSAVCYDSFMPSAISNLKITANVNEFFKDKTNHIIHLSSASALEENKFQSVYNYTKYLTEEMVSYYIQNYQIPSTIVRFCQIIDHEGRSKIIQKGFHYIVDSIKNNIDFNLFVKNDCKRSYISIEFVCEAVEYIILNQILGIQNVVLEPKLNLKELKDLLISVKGYSGKVNLIDKEALNYQIPQCSEMFVEFAKEHNMTNYLKSFV